MKHEGKNRNAPVQEASAEQARMLTPEQKLREKVDGAGGPGPAVELQQFRGDYEKTVDAHLLAGLPGASIGENVARLIAGEEISGLKLDRVDVLKDLAEDVAREAVIHLALEGVAELLEVDELALHEMDLVEIAGGPPELAQPLDIRLTQEVYKQAVSRIFPSHQLDELSSFVDDLAQETARRCAGLDKFRQALEKNNTRDAGRIFHEEANKVFNQWAEKAPERLPKDWTSSAEKTIQSGRGGSRADVLIEKAGTGANDFDWKRSGQSALTKKAIDQMDKHMVQLYEGMRSAVPLRVESRSWKDYIPNALKEWRESDAGKAAMKNDLNHEAVRQEGNTAARKAEASNSVQEQMKQSRNVVERASADASQTVNSSSSEMKRHSENLEGWLQNQPDRELSSAANTVQQMAQEALNKAQEVAQSIFRIVEAALQPNNASSNGPDPRQMVDAALSASRDLQQFATNIYEANQKATETAADALFAGKLQEARQAMRDAEQQVSQMRDRVIDDMRRSAEVIQAAQAEHARSEAARAEQRHQEEQRAAER